MLVGVNCFLRVMISVKENKRDHNKIFIRVLDKIVSLAPTHLPVQ